MCYDELLNYIFSSILHFTMSPLILVKGLDAQGNEVPNWEFSVLAAANLFSKIWDCSIIDDNKVDNLNIGLGWHILKFKSLIFGIMVEQAAYVSFGKVVHTVQSNYIRLV